MLSVLWAPGAVLAEDRPTEAKVVCGDIPVEDETVAFYHWCATDGAFCMVSVGHDGVVSEPWCMRGPDNADEFWDKYVTLPRALEGTAERVG